MERTVFEKFWDFLKEAWGYLAGGCFKGLAWTFLGLEDGYEAAECFLEVVLPLTVCMVCVRFSTCSPGMPRWVLPFLSAAGFWLFLKGMDKRKGKRKDTWPSIWQILRGAAFWAFALFMFCQLCQGLPPWPKVPYENNPWASWFWVVAVLIPVKRKKEDGK
ncbi:MAG: hypothetical protein J6Y62_07070 [Clostridia bacterium]|nr:hypothetical protein [Clostridia bacterium]